MRNYKAVIETERLILRYWELEDADDLYEYAKDPDIGPSAGWPAHKNLEESKNTIKNILCSPLCYAICLKENNKPIGSIELKLATNVTNGDDECEIGYWIGKPFWGNGYVTEAAKTLIQHAFEDLAMNTIWCCYRDGNEKSKRVQQKCGFEHHSTDKSYRIKALNETVVRHINVIRKKQWENR